jgi:trehalose 6-phosphate phosphatase
VTAFDPLQPLAEEPARAAILLDVDGTLAPIVPDPAAASVPDETRVELSRLCDRYALVACISGRPGPEAARVVGVPQLTYIGEHGLELDPQASAWADRLHAFAADVAWADIEKKPLSVSFHYRRSPDPGEARRALEEVARRASAAGLVPRFGRMVLELRPPTDANKGTAVAHLLDKQGLRRALYAGDDTTDLDAFGAVHELEIGVCVAVVTPEGPPGLREEADLVVSSPRELVRVLREL